jgi:hypothetical protein
MNFRTRTLLCSVALAATACAGAAWAQDQEAEIPPPPPPPPTLSDAIAGGRLILESRLRYETVDQANIVQKADAMTLRTRLGWETSEFNNFRGLVEFEDVRQLGSERYNIAVPGPGGATLNGKTTYPIINDPEVTELNRLQLAWTPNGMFSTTVGRQRILFDDQRFVGNVGWRQDEQTFDAARFDVGYGKVKATYAYVDKVNRILGEARDWTGESHLLNATWSISEQLKLQGFYYGLEFDNSAVNSTETTGARATGKVWAGLVQVAYGATFANQQPYADNAAVFDLDYLQADVAGTFDIYTLRLNYERLEGDGVRGFTTPLATTHAFNGWSDAFVSAGGNKSHVDGLEDISLSLVMRPRFRYAYWMNTELTVRYHDFSSERTGVDLGQEWDAQVTAAITPKLSFLIKYADFRAEAPVLGSAAPPPSRRKAWLSLEYKL